VAVEPNRKFTHDLLVLSWLHIKSMDATVPFSENFVSTKKGADRVDGMNETLPLFVKLGSVFLLGRRTLEVFRAANNQDFEPCPWNYRLVLGCLTERINAALWAEFS
jgi:hypothetical protein